MAQVRMIRMAAGALTREAWSPFGWLPVDDTEPSDGNDTLHFEWADPHLNVIAHNYDEIEHTEHGAVCSMMYRHETHTQALMPLNCDSIRAFLLHPQDVLVLHRGTWHWGPYPVGADPVRLLNVQGRRYAQDNTSVDLAATTGAVVEVVAALRAVASTD
jgi:ureidoglycolate hydrolase